MLKGRIKQGDKVFYAVKMEDDKVWRSHRAVGEYTKKHRYAFLYKCSKQVAATFKVSEQDEFTTQTDALSVSGMRLVLNHLTIPQAPRS